MGDVIQIGENGRSFPAYLAKPEGRTKGGLILIHEVWGLTDHIKSVADRFAVEGYLILAPDLLSETGITTDLVGGLQEELFDPQRRSEAQPKLRQLMAPLQSPGLGEKTLAKIGITGFCFGGTYSFSLAVRQPKLRAAVAFYGHADFSVQQLRQIKCPILAFYGENDERLMVVLPELKTKMKKAGVDFTAKVYKNCGHAFFNDTNKFAYNDDAAKDAWRKTLKFLSLNLK
jgi:carboxymethylenebutenolidase